MSCDLPRTYDTTKPNFQSRCALRIEAGRAELVRTPVPLSLILALTLPLLLGSIYTSIALRHLPLIWIGSWLTFLAMTIGACAAVIYERRRLRTNPVLFCLDKHSGRIEVNGRPIATRVQDLESISLFWGVHTWGKGSITHQLFCQLIAKTSHGHEFVLAANPKIRGGNTQALHQLAAFVPCRAETEGSFWQPISTSRAATPNQPSTPESASECT